MSIVIDILNQEAIDNLLDDMIEIVDPKMPKKQFDDILICKDCREHFPMAEPNQEDGSLICYSCRLTR